VGATEADVRNVMVEGPSGILAVSRPEPDKRPEYFPSLGRLKWPNGVIACCFSADEPERLRGPQHDAAWIDEPGAWRRGREAFDMLMFGLRLGTNPRVCITTTPRATELIKTLAADPRTQLVRGTTYENRLHLAPSFFSEIVSKYEGTRLGEQEINAPLLEITDGGTDHSIGSRRDHLEGGAKVVLFTVWFLLNCAQLSTSLSCSSAALPAKNDDVSTPAVANLRQLAGH
jgi:phage terminase large subunit-like protein